MTEKCDYCRGVITDIPVYLPKFMAKATMSSPAEWDEVPLHQHCAEIVTSPEHQERDQERRSLRGFDADDIARCF